MTNRIGFFQKKVYTHSQRSVHIRIQSYIITHIRTANALFFNTPRNLPYLKMTVKLQNRLISNARLRLQLSYFFVNLPTQELQNFNTEAVASVATVDQNLPIEHFSQPAVGSVNDATNVATTGVLARLEVSKIVFRRGSARTSRGRAYDMLPPSPL